MSESVRAVKTVSVQEFCEAVYCTLTRWEAFVPDETQHIRFIAVDAAASGWRLFQVEFFDVRDFRWQEEHELPQAGPVPRPFPDARLELSDVELEREGDEWRFWCDPWYCRTVEFHCTEIRLNGVAVSGTGKWLQDELPRAHPEVPPYNGEAPELLEAILDLPRAG